jgi:splicing factor 3B subunit 3
VIDGDLCERYSLLPSDKKAMIAGELDRSVREVERKLSVSTPAVNDAQSKANKC